MRKLVALVVCAVLLLSCCAALGEGLDIKPEDITVDLSKTESKKIDFKLSTSDFASKASDIVTRKGNVYTVVSGDVTFELNLEKFPSVLCFTQDIVSCIDAYLHVENYTEFANNMIEDGLNFILADPETNLMNYIFLYGSDDLSTMIDNFSSLPEDSQKTVVLLSGATDVVKAGTISWMKFSSKLVTMIHGQYLVVEYGGSNDAEADLQDTLDILSNLKLK